MVIYFSTLTPDGQVTLPEEVREAPDLHPEDRIGFKLEDGMVTLTHEQSQPAWRAGILKPLPGMIDDLDQVIQEAKEDYFAEKYPEFSR